MGHRRGTRMDFGMIMKAFALMAFFVAALIVYRAVKL